VQSNPEWFTTRADGTVAYAENPPKKYQDIFPINFDNDPEGFYQEALRLLKLWISRGVRIFRVDNPHTKPVNFWEWIIGEINAEYPDVIFLAEAFTRPAMMHMLGKVGYQQSYTYFTWRNTKHELTQYLNELAHSSSAFFRPNLWVALPTSWFLTFSLAEFPVTRYVPQLRLWPEAAGECMPVTNSLRPPLVLAPMSTSTRKSMSTSRAIGPQPTRLEPPLHRSSRS
jgi:glycosidase